MVMGSGQKRKNKYAEAQVSRYKDVDFAKGPETYRSASGYDLLYKLGDFKAGGTYHIADLACGSGLVGIELAKRVRKNNGSAKITFVDIVQENLEKIRKGPKRDMRISDLREINAEDDEFTHSYCRYAVKNLYEEGQIQALGEISRVSEHIFVLQDMVSPYGLKEFQTRERWAKNAAAGDSVTRHNIPTENEWFEMLENSGFEVDNIIYRTSHVNTSDWVRGKQLTQDGLKVYFDFLEEARKKWPLSWEEYKIGKVEDGYELTYPVIFIKCKKR